MSPSRRIHSRKSQRKPVRPEQAINNNDDGSSLPPQRLQPDKTTDIRGTSPKPGLPERYDQDLMKLMLQDPFTLYCYWEVTPRTLAGRGLSASNDEVLVVRVHPDDADHFDVGVGGAVGSAYINLENGGGAYFVELGLRSADGSFHPILRSNTVMLPSVGVSAVEDLLWRGVDELYPRTPDPCEPGGHLSLRPCLVNSYSSLDLSSASLVRKKER